MKILHRKDAINRRLYKGLIIVETAIYRVSWLNRTILLPKLHSSNLYDIPYKE